MNYTGMQLLNMMMLASENACGYVVGECKRMSLAELKLDCKVEIVVL